MFDCSLFIIQPCSIQNPNLNNPDFPTHLNSSKNLNYAALFNNVIWTNEIAAMYPHYYNHVLKVVFKRKKHFFS